MSLKKKLFIKSYGCQMNVYDSQRMTESLNNEGYEVTEAPDHADLILLNTCHIREKAAEKVYSELGRYKNLKALNPDLKLGVAGLTAIYCSIPLERYGPLRHSIWQSNVSNAWLEEYPGHVPLLLHQ